MVDKKLQTIIKKASKGDKKSYIELCEKLGQDVLYLCRLNMRNAEDAEDAAQEVFIQMQKSIHNLQKPEAFKGWLSRLVSNTCITLRRNKMNCEPNVPLEAVEGILPSETLAGLPQQYIEDALFREQIVEIVKKLPDEYRQCVLMHYFQQLSYKEVAEALEVSEDKVGYNLRMARKHMKVEIDELRQKDAKLWQQAPMLAFGPALQTILSESAKATVTPEALNACLQAAGVYHTAATSTAAGTAIGAKTVLQAAAIVTATTVSLCAAVYTVQRIVETTPATSYSSSGEAPGFPQGQGAFAEDWDDEDKPAQTAMVSGRVYIDNSNVVDPLAHMGLAGVEVELVRVVDDKVVATTKTEEGNDSGLFLLKGFALGDYRMRVKLPQGLTPISSGGYEADGEQGVWLKNQGSTIFTFKGGKAEETVEISLALRNNATISGKVSVQAGEQELISPLPAVAVQLQDPQGRTLAETEAREDGQYQFANPAISQNGSYTLLFKVGDVAGLRVPLDSTAFSAKPGQSVTLPTRQLSDTYPPQIKLVMTGSTCGCGHENPTGVEISVYDATPSILRWEIVQFHGGEKVAEGNNAEEFSQIISALGNGEYTLIVTAQDTAGNSAEAKQEISISRNE